MRTAYEKGYDVITLTDCTAAPARGAAVGGITDYPMSSR
jgi:hypothetical protein